MFTRFRRWLISRAMKRRAAEPLTAADQTRRAQLLVPVGRWTPGRKAALFQALRDGVLTISEASAAHRFSHDELDAEFMTWVRGGKQALRVTKRGKVA